MTPNLQSRHQFWIPRSHSHWLILDVPKISGFLSFTKGRRYHVQHYLLMSCYSKKIRARKLQAQLPSKTIRFYKENSLTLGNWVLTVKQCIKIFVSYSIRGFTFHMDTEFSEALQQGSQKQLCNQYSPSVTKKQRFTIKKD